MIGGKIVADTAILTENFQPLMVTHMTETMPGLPHTVHFVSQAVWSHKLFAAYKSRLPLLPAGRLFMGLKIFHWKVSMFLFTANTSFPHQNWLPKAHLVVRGDQESLAMYL